MKKTLLGSVIALLAAAALGAVPAVAAAETGPHWFSQGRLLSGEPISVPGKGEITLSPRIAGDLEFYECGIRDNETISNPPGGGAGTDEMVALKISHCALGREQGFCGFAKLQVIPIGLPWHSQLAFGSSNQVDDVFEGVALELRCKTGRTGVFSGMLSGVFEEGPPNFGRGVSGLNFFSESNRLSDGSEPMYLEGEVKFKGHGHNAITAG
jgi:hypothetical protein